MNGFAKVLKKILEAMFINLTLIKKEDYKSLHKELNDIKKSYSSSIKTIGLYKGKLQKAASDAMFFAGEAVELKKKVAELESEYADDILPTTGISFEKTVSNIKGMTSRARTTLLFRIVQVLTQTEKEALLSYINYEKVEKVEDTVSDTTSSI